MIVGTDKNDIASNANLNDGIYLHPGYYKCMFNDVANTLINCPTSYAFTMIVTNATGGNVSANEVYLCQYLFPYLVNGMFFRQITKKVDGTIWFSDWYEMATINSVYELVYLPQREKIVSGGLQHTITVEGQADYYYPIYINCPDNHNDFSNRLCISKKLFTKTASFSGNHTSGTSSCSFEYLWRSKGWDGNGCWCKTIHHSEPYASLVANTRILNDCANGGIVIWLRGGGTEYKITSDVYITYKICYEETNIIDETAYSYIVAPTTDIENAGVLDYEL